MIVFNTDLDNTLIYSYKHNIGNNRVNVELYNGREISFVSKKSLDLLKELSEQVLIVPTTTRSIEQYNRIDFGIKTSQYALVCNGGVLLNDGVVDENWYKDSLELIKEHRQVMDEAQYLLEIEKMRYFEVRYIENLFLFTKCREPQMVVHKLEDFLDRTQVDVFNNGEKVYVVPKPLNKGTAVTRLRDLLHPEFVMAAGDSEFDVSMVRVADIGYVPFGFKSKYNVFDESVYELGGTNLFSEELLSMCLTNKAKQ